MLTKEAVSNYLGFVPRLWPAAGSGPEETVSRLTGEVASLAGAGSSPALPFSNVLQQAWQQLNSLHQQADEAARKVATGDPTGPTLAQAVQLTEEAALALSLFVAVRNRALEAYQEIMRMPV
ncbi:MAG TPA: flagellar hook-basal body complex protein FliE [Firmicutes bacterium]|nr:flagellar hook-basal body complex protein FliE [Bacillota bacterium]